MPLTLLQDMLDDGAPIDVIADVTFLSTAEGGRTRAARDRYRPNHNFGAAGTIETYVGQIEFAPGDEVAPGDARRVRIRFLSGPGLDGLLTVGRQWRIQEGSMLVARATLVKRLSDVRPSHV